MIILRLFDIIIYIMKTQIFSNDIAVERSYLRSTAFFVQGVYFTFLAFERNTGHCRDSTDDFKTHILNIPILTKLRIYHSA